MCGFEWWYWIIVVCVEGFGWGWYGVFDDVSIVWVLLGIGI